MSFSLPAIFAAGLLTFASPCVLPLIPIYLATLAGGSLEGSHPPRTLRVAVAFALGFASVFVALGALASSVGSFLVTYRTPIMVASGALMVLFGVRALGLLRVPALERDARPALSRIRNASSLGGASMFGMAFALGWSPCIGPVLAAVLAYAATHAHTPALGALYLGVYAAGIAAPLLVLAAAASKAAAWIKRARSVIPRLERVTGLALVIIGLGTAYSAMPLHDARTNAGAELAATSCEAGGGPGHTCGLSAAQEGDAVDVAVPLTGAQMLEFTAHDCPVCRRMRPVLEKLMAACMELDARFVRVDVASTEGRALADRFGVRGTPTYVLLDADGVERARLLGESSSEELAAAVERAFGLSCWG